MKYVGLYTQQVRNNTRSMLLLVFFPLIMLGMVFTFIAILQRMSVTDAAYFSWHEVLGTFFSVMPFVLGGVGVWFMIAYWGNTAMIRHATGARPLERRENPRVYNIVENLTMSCGMDMPQVNIIDTPQLNAFASGIDRDSYTVTLTSGICEQLNDEELAGVIGHELTHIRNRDTRLLIVSIIFVGIMSTLSSLTIRLLWNTFFYGDGSSRRRSSDSNSKGGGGVSVIVALAVAAILAAVGYLFTLLTRFAISRRREYMADAGGAEITGNPLALASALRKISAHPALADTNRQDVAQLFIIHPRTISTGLANFLSGLFATHPSTESRIAYLEQF